MRISAGVTSSRPQIRQSAAGVLDQTLPQTMMNGTSAPGTQVVYGFLLGLKVGDVATGIMLRNTVAAAGAAPTMARFGLADASGKIVALSANLGAPANWAAGPIAFPFSAPYKAPLEGGYIGCFVVNGVWGTTQPLIARQAGIQAAALGAFGAAAPEMFTWAAQTDLPAVGASLTMTGITNPLAFYLAVY